MLASRASSSSENKEKENNNTWNDETKKNYNILEYFVEMVTCSKRKTIQNDPIGPLDPYLKYIWKSLRANAFFDNSSWVLDACIDTANHHLGSGRILLRKKEYRLRYRVIMYSTHYSLKSISFDIESFFFNTHKLTLLLAIIYICYAPQLTPDDFGNSLLRYSFGQNKMQSCMNRIFFSRPKKTNQINLW